MALISKTTTMKWNTKNKIYYESKGYIFTKWKDKFEVKTEDLSKGCGVHIEAECDECGKTLRPAWDDYKNHLHEGNTYYCTTCANRLFGINKSRKTRLDKGVSFKQWCENNLSKEECSEILSRWDYELNIDKLGNRLTPKDVGHGSMGTTRRGYYFKCLDHPEHNSELHSINNFTKGGKSIFCNQCNSLAVKHPDLIKYFVNEEDTHLAALSGKKVLMKCPDCGYIKLMNISQLTNYHFSCPKCGEFILYPEKFMFSVLEQSGCGFEPQLSKSTFKWCKNYRYDFYIPSLNCIIETHGMQHYEQTARTGKTLPEEQENDRIKEKLAIENGIDNYFQINCSYSKLDFIKSNILDSNLSSLLDLTKIDWSKCHEDSCSRLVKETYALWNSGITNVIEIAKIMDMSKSSVWKYLNQVTNFEGFKR